MLRLNYGCTLNPFTSHSWSRERSPHASTIAFSCSRFSRWANPVSVRCAPLQDHAITVVDCAVMQSSTLWEVFLIITVIHNIRPDSSEANVRPSNTHAVSCFSGHNRRLNIVCHISTNIYIVCATLCVPYSYAWLFVDLCPWCAFGAVILKHSTL